MKKHYVYDLGSTVKKVGATNNPSHRIPLQGFDNWEPTILKTFTSAFEADVYEKEKQWELYGYEDKDFYPDMLQPLVIKHQGKATCTLSGVPYEDADAYLVCRKVKVISLFSDEEFLFETDEDIEWLQSNKRKGFKKAEFVDAYWYLEKIRNYFANKIEIVEPTDADDILLKQTMKGTLPQQYSEDWSFDNIRQWAYDKKLYGHENSSLKGQALKLGEEFGECQKAILKDNTKEVKDAIGDMVVVLTSIAELNGHSIEEAIQHAWEVIRIRKGKPSDNGDWIKED